MASKRRRRLKLNLSSLFALVLVNLLIAGSASHHHHHHNYHHHHHHYQQHPHSDQLTVLSPSSQQQAALQVSPMHLCSQLPSQVSKHMKLCKLIGHSPSADEAVAVGTAKGLAECKSQFKSERWNCSHSMGDQHLLTSELALTVGSREGAFVQAIAAAGIVHSIATACSVGSLSDCACDKSRIGLIGRQDENWKWGGCSNNIRHGMLFAKNLVELSDAVHQQQLRHQQQRHWLKKRALTSRHREPNQVRSRDLSTMQEVGTFVGGLQQTTTTNSNSQLCQRNHNITQATHLQLIKSLMAKNSLQRHQEIRLAMNMHNNKVGRMAVAKNMVLMCRCHGLSGSCSLKTCWLILPDFQVIGSYLKRKYESSIHLAKAINVNKLIPMMDRGEVSSILVGGSASPSSTPPSQQPVTPVVATTTTASTTTAPETEPPVNEPASMPEYAALVAPQMSSKRGLMSGHLMIPPSQPARTLFSANLTSLQHYNYYERHKQLQQVVAQSTTSSSSISINDQTIPVNLSPMTQQQYQLLLRELKLCNINNSSSDLHTSYLQTRDLGSELLAGKSTSRQSNKLLHHQNGQLLKAANQQLSQLLHSNKDDLIHLHRSPDYCEADASQGFAGTQARVCSADPWAPDNCDKLCCGRGYTVIVQQHPEKCDCKFRYCCAIRCSVCHKNTTVHVCN